MTIANVGSASTSLESGSPVAASRSSTRAMPTKLSRTNPTRGSITPPFPSPPRTRRLGPHPLDDVDLADRRAVDGQPHPLGHRLGHARGREVHDHRPLDLREPVRGRPGPGSVPRRCNGPSRRRSPAGRRRGPARTRPPRRRPARSPRRPAGSPRSARADGRNGRPGLPRTIGVHPSAASKAEPRRPPAPWQASRTTANLRRRIASTSTIVEHPPQVPGVGVGHVADPPERIPRGPAELATLEPGQHVAPGARGRGPSPPAGRISARCTRAGCATPRSARPRPRRGRAQPTHRRRGRRPGEQRIAPRGRDPGQDGRGRTSAPSAGRRARRRSAPARSPPHTPPRTRPRPPGRAHRRPPPAAPRCSRSASRPRPPPRPSPAPRPEGPNCRGRRPTGQDPKPTTRTFGKAGHAAGPHPVDQLRALDVFRATAARTRAFNAPSSIPSPSRKSMARLVFPSRLELKRPEGSSSAAPLAKVIFTTFR